MYTVIPDFASCVAIPFPMPREPPVTMPTAPSSAMIDRQKHKHVQQLRKQQRNTITIEAPRRAVKLLQ